MKTFAATFLVLCLGATPSLFADSLWTSPANSEHSMYSDRKASRVGDILTVVISESVAQQLSQSTKSSKTSSIDAGISQFIYPPAVSGLATHGGALPATKMTGTNSFAGAGDISNSQSLSGRAAVLVTDVLPNGNLVIEGVRVITFSGETQYVVLHGLVRADDVTSTNTVDSTNVADVRLEFISEGALTDAQKRGWITKIYDTLRPY
jgi:flagellar L-ring protein precursor FlgH